MSDNNNIEAVNQTLKYSTEQFDKNILFIASGALGISFAFIKDIIPNLKEATCKSYLIASWYIFASVIFISLVTHFISMMANRWAIRNSYLDDDSFNTKIEYWNIPIRILNATTILAILAGALSLIYFINHNIST
jgi:hypothetical protein